MTYLNILKISDSLSNVISQLHQYIVYLLRTDSSHFVLHCFIMRIVMSHRLREQYSVHRSHGRGILTILGYF